MSKLKNFLFVTLVGLLVSSCDKDDDNNPVVTVTVPSQLSVSNAQFFPEDVVVHDNKDYVSGFGDGSIQKFDLTQSTATAQQIATAENSTYSASWGLNVDASKSTLLNIANAPYFFNGSVAAPAKVNAYKLSDNSKVSSWTLPTGTVGNSIVVANGFYYIGDIGPTTRIIKLNPNDGSTTIKTDAQWSNGFGFGGMIYANNGIYGVHGGKMWYIPVASNGDLGTVSEVTGISNVFADGMTWAGNNTIYYCQNDAQDPANVGIVWKVTLTSNTAATATQASIPNNGSLNNPSGIFYKEINNKKYLFVNESQIFNTPTTPFKVNIHEIN